MHKHFSYNKKLILAVSLLLFISNIKISETHADGLPCEKTTVTTVSGGGEPNPAKEIVEQILGGFQETQEKQDITQGAIDEIIPNNQASLVLKLKGEKRKIYDLKKIISIFKKIVSKKSTTFIENVTLLSPLSLLSGEVQPAGKIEFIDSSRTDLEQLMFSTSKMTAFSYQPIIENGKARGAQFEFQNILYDEPGEKKLDLYDVVLKTSSNADGKSIATKMFVLNKNLLTADEMSQLIKTPCEQWEAALAKIITSKKSKTDGLHALCKQQDAYGEAFYAQKSLAINSLEVGQDKKQSDTSALERFKITAQAIGKRKLNSATAGKMIEALEVSQIHLELEGLEYVYSGNKIQSQLDESGALVLKDLLFSSPNEKRSKNVLNIHQLKWNPKDQSSLMLEIQKHPKHMIEDPMIHLAYSRLLAKERKAKEYSDFPSLERELLKKISQIFLTQKNQELTNLDWIYIHKFAYDFFHELHLVYKVANDTQIELLNYLGNLKPAEKKLEKQLESNIGASLIEIIPYQPQYYSEKVSLSLEDLKREHLKSLEENLKIKNIKILRRSAFATDIITGHDLIQTKENGKDITRFAVAELSKLSSASRLPFGVASVLAEAIPGLKEFMGKEKIINFVSVNLNQVKFNGTLREFLGNLTGGFQSKNYNYRDFSKMLLQSNGRFEIKTGVSREKFSKENLFTEGQSLTSHADLTKKISEIQDYKNRGEANLTEAYIDTAYDMSHVHSHVDLDHLRDGVGRVVVQGVYSNPKAIVRTLWSAVLPTGAGFFLMDGEGLIDGMSQYHDKDRIEIALKNERNILMNPSITLDFVTYPGDELEDFMELRTCQSLNFQTHTCVINTQQKIASITFRQISNQPCVLGKTLHFKSGAPASISVSDGCQVDLEIKIIK